MMFSHIVRDGGVRLWMRCASSNVGIVCELVIHQKFPDIFVQSGIMERGNFSAAAGFGMAKDRQVRLPSGPRACRVLALPLAAHAAARFSPPSHLPHLPAVPPFGCLGVTCC